MLKELSAIIIHKLEKGNSQLLRGPDDNHVLRYN